MGKTSAKPKPGSFASFELATDGAIRQRKPSWRLRPERGYETGASVGPERLGNLADDVMRGLGRKPD